MYDDCGVCGGNGACQRLSAIEQEVSRKLSDSQEGIVVVCVVVAVMFAVLVGAVVAVVRKVSSLPQVPLDLSGMVFTGKSTRTSDAAQTAFNIMARTGAATANLSFSRRISSPHEAVKTVDYSTKSKSGSRDSSPRWSPASFTSTVPEKFTFGKKHGRTRNGGALSRQNAALTQAAAVGSGSFSWSSAKDQC